MSRSDAPNNRRVKAQKGPYSRYTFNVAVTFHSGRYRGVASDLRVLNVLGGPPIAIAVEIAKTTPQDHCGLARSTPLQRGTPHTFALTSLSTSWHSSHAASHDHPGFLPEPRRPWHLLTVPFVGHGLVADAGPPWQCKRTNEIAALEETQTERMAGKPPSPAQARVVAACIDFLGCFTHFLQTSDVVMPAAQVCSIQQT